MQDQIHILVFSLDARRFALPAANCIRVIPAVEITPLPDAPDNILGLINVAGTLVPVFDLRRKFHLPARMPDPDQFLILALTTQCNVALLVDEVEGLFSISPQRTLGMKSLMESAESVGGAVIMDGDIVLIQNLDRFLSDREDEELQTALDRM